MKTRKYISQEQPLAVGIGSFLHQQQQASAGVISADLATGTNDDLAAEAVGAEQPRATLGATIASIIEASRATGAKKLRVADVDTNVREIRCYPVATTVPMEEIHLTLERDLVGDEEHPSKVAPWTLSDGADLAAGGSLAGHLKTAIEALLAPAKPRFSLASLISKLEDLREEDSDVRMVSGLVIDQTDDGIIRIGLSGTAPASPEVVILQDTTPVTSSDDEPLPFE